VVLTGTSGAGKKTLAHALLRHMGEDGPGDEEEGGVLGQPKQAALINNQKCIIHCDDIWPDDDEGDMSETGSLLPKDTGRGVLPRAHFLLYSVGLADDSICHTVPFGRSEKAGPETWRRGAKAAEEGEYFRQGSQSKRLGEG